MSLGLFGIGSLRRETPAEELQQMKRTAAHLVEKIRQYRSDKMPDWMIRDEESSLVWTRRAISVLEAKVNPTSKALAG